MLLWCLISQANAVVFEVRVDPKAKGQECLEKVCENLGITSESDYFGLKYESNKGEELWLNLRNPIDRQVTCHGSSVRLALRVKFWVPPHLLLEETTRHQFYLHAKLELFENRLLASNWDCVSRLIALIAQAESGDYDPLHPPHNVYMQASSIASSCSLNKPHDLLQRIINEHKKYKDMKSSTAKYWLLKEISELETFGDEMFYIKPHNMMLGVGPHGMTVYEKIGVGPHGITVYEKDKEKYLISFTSIITASSHRRTFRLEYLMEDNKEGQLEVKLDTVHLASGLYRAITEKHAFYSCETVRSAVTAQFIRDIKGTIVSIFNEDSTLGKKYVFDIKRTCREVYDNARRQLHVAGDMQIVPEDEKDGCTHSGGEQCKNSQERLKRLVEAMTCKICMDQQIDAVFLPCGHMVSCTTCSARCESCPLCRTGVVHVQKLYLPGEFRQELC